VKKGVNSGSVSSRRRISRWYRVRPNPSEETARTTFIHRGMFPRLARNRRPMAFHENEYRVRSIRLS
jgi:hypothetical protein